MKIIEVRDGFIKFEADKNVYLSSFIQVSGVEKKYIAQVIQLKDDGIYPLAYAKILFMLDKDGLSDYDKTVPSEDSEITVLPYNKISELKEKNSPVVIGYTKLGEDISVDSSALNKKLLINADDKDELRVVLENIAGNLNKAGKRVIFIDMSGRLDLMKYTAGADFKLPLNTASLSFMYEECLNDATDESKALVTDIFKELSEYSKTVTFVPFETLKSIVDDMVDNSHIFKLLVLKNKLSKFARMGYFASVKEEVDKLQAILKSRNAVLDLSKLDSLFQNRYLEFIYDSLKLQNNVQVFVDLSNSVSKKGIKRIFDTIEVSTAFIAHSKFKYINEIKNLFENFMILPSADSMELFKTYKTFLNAMDKDTYLIAGEAVNYIPLISESVKNVIKQEPAAVADAGENEAVNSDDISDSEILECVTDGLTENEEDEAPTDAPEVANIFDADEENFSEETENFGDIQEQPEIILEETVDNSEEPEEEPIQELETETDTDTDTDIEAIEEESELVEESEKQVEDTVESDIAQEAEVVDFPESDEDIPVQGYEEITLNEELEEPEIIQDMSPLVSEDINLEIDNNSVIEIDDSSDVASASDDNVSAEQEVPVIPISYNESEDEIVDIQELDPDEANENDIVVDMESDFEEIDSDIDDEIARDVDKVYTTRKDYDISDSDLDLIDELNSDEDDTLLEAQDDDSVLEELSEASSEGEIIEVQPIEPEEPKEEDKAPEILETRDASTPIVPVYDADIPQEDMVISDPIQQGDNVVHAKYGNGVVEKMIKYGNKTLFSINFDNVGRRLLDPTLTEIKKS